MRNVLVEEGNDVVVRLIDVGFARPLTDGKDWDEYLIEQDWRAVERIEKSVSLCQ